MQAIKVLCATSSSFPSHCFIFNFFCACSLTKKKQISVRRFVPVLPIRCASKFLQMFTGVTSRNNFQTNAKTEVDSMK